MDLKVPPFPWAKGKNPEYAAFVIEVHVCQSKLEQVFSCHFLQDEKDEEVIRDLTSSGQEQIAFGLLTEAIRQEAFVEVLIKLQENPKFLEEFAEDPANQSGIIQELSTSLSKLFLKLVPDMALDAVKEVFERMLLQGPKGVEEKGG